MSWRDELADRAKQALSKKPKLGMDVDLSDYILSLSSYVQNLEEQDLRNRALSVGIDLDGKNR
ncbi:MAG: hypothetical protein DRJ31_04790, partial [Candidatus Methanomethylicota archaeon]